MIFISSFLNEKSQLKVLGLYKTNIYLGHCITSNDKSFQILNQSLKAKFIVNHQTNLQIPILWMNPTTFVTVAVLLHPAGR